MATADKEMENSNAVTDIRAFNVDDVSAVSVCQSPRSDGWEMELYRKQIRLWKKIEVFRK